MHRGKPISATHRLICFFQIIQYIMRGQFPIDNRDGLVMESRVSLIKYMEEEHHISNQILHSIFQLKKEVVELRLEANQGNIEAANATDDMSILLSLRIY